MDVKIFDKKRLPSRHVTHGSKQAQRRSYYYSMGLINDRFNAPFVGVVSRWSEAAVSLPHQGRKAEKSVAGAHDAQREIRTAAVTDGSAMGHQDTKSSRVSRKVIAGGIQVTIRSYCSNATVAIAGCNKSLSGMMMARVRLNVPSIFMYGNSILPGKFKRREMTVVDVFEAVGQDAAGKMPDGNMNSIDAENGRLDGPVSKYAQQVGSARLGAVTHPGAKSEVIVYADQ